MNEIFRKDYSLLLHTSIIEGFPNVLIESMANGIPNIITTNSCDEFSNMPNLTVIDDHNKLPEHISLAINNSYDYSKSYFSYVESNHNFNKYFDETFQ